MKKLKNLLEMALLRVLLIGMKQVYHIRWILKWKYNTSDIDIRNINHEYITDYDFYLRSERKCSNNTTVKYIKNFKKIIRICISNGWLEKDPFVRYKPKIKEVERPFLTADEIKAISAKEFTMERLTLVKDIFLFSCYTGLAYIDVANLSPTNMVIGIDGKHWIKTFRTKTEVPSNIPLLPPALDIINKYKNHPVAINKGKVLPVISNQKMNAYLKEISTVCGITKVHELSCSPSYFCNYSNTF
jgi:integrase